MPRPGDFKFNKLPTELRLDIWKACIHAQRRLIILDFVYERIRPTRNLISPLLFTNRESRLVAQSMYQTHLPVIKVDPEDVEHENRGPCRGMVYTNLETDVFVLGIQRFHLSILFDEVIDKAQVQYKAGCKPQQPGDDVLFTPCNYFIPAMSPEVSKCGKTMLVVNVRETMGYDEHGRTSLWSEGANVEHYTYRWGRWSPLLPNVDTCSHLWVDFEVGGTLGEITRDLCRCTFSEFLQKWKFDYQICHRNTTNE